MKKTTCLLTLLLIAFFSNLSFSQTFDWESATFTDSNTTVSEVKSGITATVSGISSDINFLNAGNINGTSGNVVFTSNTNDNTSVTIAFTGVPSVNLASVKAFDSQLNGSSNWTFTPVPLGTNTAVSTAISGNVSTVVLNFTAITSIIVTSSAGLESFGFDDVVLGSGTAAPTVVTIAATPISSSNATLFGNVTADGGDPITERGFVYSLTSTDATPTVAEATGANVTKVIVSGTTGEFNQALSSLTSSTGYSFAAYAINSSGTTQGLVQTFTTIAAANDCLITNPYDASNTNTNELNFGQSFVACQSGTLKSIALLVGFNETSTGETINVYSGSTTNSGNLLGSVTGQEFTENGGDATNLDITDFSGQGINLIAGQTYTFDIPTTSRLVYTTDNGYPNGDIYINGIANGGDFDLIFNVVVEGAACTNPDVPTAVSASPSEICPGTSSTISWTGALNNASLWHIYTGSCGGTQVGTSATNSFTTAALTADTTFYIRGEDGTGCVDEASGACEQITVSIDSTNPSTVTQNINAYLDAAGNVSITASDVDGGSTDNCGTVNLSVSTTNFTCANLGANSVTLTRDDGNGNTSSTTAVVTVVDTISPVTVAQNITAFLDGAGNVSITTGDIDGGSVDNCGTVNFSASGTTFTCADLGPNNITLTTNDGSGNSSNATAVVTVLDTISPVTVAQNITAYLDGAGNVSITTGDIDGGSSDNCGTTNFSASGTTFTCADLGANNVTLTTDDGNGNTSNATAFVTVTDTISPVAVTQNITAFLDGTGTVSITASDIDGGSSDNCSIQNLSASGTVFTCADIGPNNVTLTITDASGNTNTNYSNVVTSTSVVTVLDTISPITVAQNITAYLDGAGNVSITTGDIDGGSVDNCGTTNFSASGTTFTCADLGPNNVTLTTDDGNGNTSNAIAVVTVTDTISPTAVALNINTFLNAAGTVSITAADLDGGSSDNCGTVNFSASGTTFTCADLGPNNVTLIVDDGNGNTTNATAVVTVNAFGDASFNYDAIAYCADALDPIPNISGTTGGAFTASPLGLDINTTTGAIDVSDSTPGSYTVTYSTAGNCSNSSSVTVTINSLDDASFSYNSLTFCADAPDQNPTITGLSGGIFSVQPFGLLVATIGGEIEVSGSTPGTYTVTYTTVGPCPNTSSVVVTVNNIDDASFNYSAAAYCQSDLDPIPSITGLAGGTFTSTAGLNINASTGAIDVSASTPGTYSVTYTTAGSCPNTSNVVVTVNSLDDAAFNYSAAAYCQSDLDPTPSITGLAGGTFTSTAGLNINASTGVIDVSASTPGTYSVTYTTAGSCPNTSNVVVTVNSLDDATFIYDATTYCSTDLDPTPTIIGLAGGSFSSLPAGLNINTSTGIINTGLSTPQAYTVTYTTAGTCPNSSTTTVTIINGTTSALPISEGFVSATFPPAGWSVNNGGNADTWVRQNGIGNAPTAGNSIWIDNFSNNNTGDEDDLVVVPVDLTNVLSAQLEFDVAYARYNATFNDRLQVLVTNDCGATYDVVYDKSGSSLATEPDQTTPYVANIWRQETVDLTAYIGDSKLNVIFKNISGYGQILYIDNINITGVSCNEPDVPSTLTASAICPGSTATITWSGALNDATSWHVYTDSCGGTQVGTTTTNSFTTAALSGDTTFYIRGEDGTGCVDEASGLCGQVTVTVNSLDDASFTSTDFCESTTNTISGIATPGGVFSISGQTGSGLAIINNVTGILSSFLAGDQITIQYTTPSGGCANASTQVVNVLALDDASFTSTDFCESTTNTISGIATPGGVFSISGQTGSGLAIINNVTGILSSFLAGDQITIQYTTPSGGCANTSTQVVNVLALDDASFNYSESTYCINDSNPTPTITGLVGGMFSSSAGLTINASTGLIDIATSTNGTYTVTYTTTGTCSNSSSVSVTIDECTPTNDECSNATTLTVGVTLAGESTAGATDSSTGTTDDTDCEPLTFKSDVWYTFVAPLSGAVNITTVISGNSDQASVAVYSSQNCSQLDVDIIACSSGNGGENIDITNLTIGQTYYVRVWSDGTAVIRNAQLTEGTFNITVTETTLSTTDFDTNGFTYYPNPVENILTLKSDNTISEVRVLNMLGQVVLTDMPNATTKNLDLSNLQSGAYFVEVSMEGNTKTIRVIKE